jgi:hypothetical protein
VRPERARNDRGAMPQGSRANIRYNREDHTIAPRSFPAIAILACIQNQSERGSAYSTFRPCRSGDRFGQCWGCDSALLR